MLLHCLWYDIKHPYLGVDKVQLCLLTIATPLALIVDVLLLPVELLSLLIYKLVVRNK